MRATCFAIAILLPATAAASPTQPDEEVTSYVAMTASIDAVSLAGMVGAVAFLPEDRLAGVGSMTAFGLMFGAPVIHAARGHFGRAAGSAGIRMMCAALGVLAVGQTDRFYGPPNSRDTYFAIGAFGGLAAASVIDALLLTEERRPRAPAWSPQVQASASGVALGVAGAF